MRTTHALSILLALLTTTRGYSASEQVVSYGPAVVTLIGRFKSQVFAGRPNYESIAHGDEREVYWILHLAKPVSVAARPKDEVDTAERHISQLQLVFTSAHPEKQYSRYRHFLGESVVVTGQLFHGITAHHKTDVLLEVQKITPLPQ